jgi:tetratricopeptide (TPR) repeat protein
MQPARSDVIRVILLLLLGWCLLGGENLLLAESSKESKADEAALRLEVLELNQLSGTNAIQGRLQELIRNETHTRQLLQVAVKMLKEKPLPLNRNTTFLLARAAEFLREVDISAALYRANAGQCLRLYSERGLSEAYIGLIQLYTNNRRHAESEKVCREFLAIEGEDNEAIERLKPLVQRRLILNVARQGAVDRALKMTDELIKSDPRNWLHRGLKSQVLREAERYEEAARVLLDVIDRISRDVRLEKEDREAFIDEQRYLLSGIYIDMNDVEKAAEQLKLLLDREPNNPTYNNDLGYIWADRGIKLEEAERLIRKALDEDRKLRRKENPNLKPENDRDNSAYLDSLGWVLFKQGKPKEALPYLLEAVKDRDGQHIEIYDHLADVQMALGNKEAAIAAWKKALEAATDSKRDQKRKLEVQKKLQAAQDK